MAIGVGGGDLFDGDYTAEQLYYTSEENTNQIILLGFAQEQDYQLNDTSDYSYGLDFILLIAKNNGSPTLPLVDKENWAVIVNQIENINFG